MSDKSDDIAAKALAGDHDAALQLISAANMSLWNNRKPATLVCRYLTEAFGRILSGEDAGIAFGLKTGKRGAPKGSPGLMEWRDWVVCRRIIDHLDANGSPPEVADSVFKEVSKHSFPDIHDGRRLQVELRKSRRSGISATL